MEAIQQTRIRSLSEFQLYLHSLNELISQARNGGVDWESMKEGLSNRLGGTDVDADAVIDNLQLLVDNLKLGRINTQEYRRAEAVIGSLHPEMLRLLEAELSSRVNPEPVSV